MRDVTDVLLIGAGGFLGAVARYGTGLLVHRAGAAVPVATLTVNVAGCFLIGLLTELLDERAGATRKLVVVGFLGSFTTFSAFGYETDNFLRHRGWSAATLNVGLNVVFGLAAVAAGRTLARRLA